jgi:type IV pilus assembly protein PilM
VALMNRLSALFQDPPPDLVFEVSETGINMARTRNPTGVVFQALPAGVVSASPLRDNIQNPDAFAESVAALVPAAGARQGKKAALILPDYSARVSVLDFDSFPEKDEDQEALVRFRIKKSVPFDVESAALSYWRQNSPGGKSHEVVVAVSPLEIIARYEAPFRAVGIQPGLVTVSPLAALDLVTTDGISVVAKVNGHVLTVMVSQQGVLKLTRSLELNEFSLAEIAADLFPTFVYVEDNLQAQATRLVLCGFADLEQAAIAQFQDELEIAVEPLRSRLGAVNGQNAGLLGYLQSTVAHPVAA